MAKETRDIRNLNKLFEKYGGVGYEDMSDNIGIPRGAEDFASTVTAGQITNSAINKLHVIKLAKNFPAMEKDIPQNNGFFQAKTAYDLCMIEGYGAIYYDIEDFLYCKNLGVPINRLITLRRFATAITDNIYQIKSARNDDADIVQGPDIARMVTYMTNDSNKMEDILAFSYGLKWKQLQSEMEQATSFGEQSGVSGFIKKIASVMDSTQRGNVVSGRSTGGPMSQYDPKFDSNRVYGPVDSITETHIRDVGLNFTKDFEITFDYEIRSINGRTPEYAMKDILGNILACTFNNGKFWPGSRYWVGERPSPWAKKLQWMNSADLDTILTGMMNTVKDVISMFSSGKSALQTLKNVVKGGFAIAISKLLDGLGRPGIPAMTSLLSGEPVGMWHLMIGNPLNPIMSIGNLILDSCDIKFPTDSLSYGDFPTKLQVVVKLKPAMPKDRGGIEMMMNHGIQKIYWNPEKVQKSKINNINRKGRYFGNEFDENVIQQAVTDAFDFLPIEGKAETKEQNGIEVIVSDNRKIKPMEFIDTNDIELNNTSTEIVEEKVVEQNEYNDESLLEKVNDSNEI